MSSASNHVDAPLDITYLDSFLRRLESDDPEVVVGTLCDLHHCLAASVNLFPHGPPLFPLIKFRLGLDEYLTEPAAGRFWVLRKAPLTDNLRKEHGSSPNTTTVHEEDGLTGPTPPSSDDCSRHSSSGESSSLSSGSLSDEEQGDDNEICVKDREELLEEDLFSGSDAEQTQQLSEAIFAALVDQNDRVEDLEEALNTEDLTSNSKLSPIPDLSHDGLTTEENLSPAPDADTDTATGASRKRRIEDEVEADCNRNDKEDAQNHEGYDRDKIQINISRTSELLPSPLTPPASAMPPMLKSAMQTVRARRRPPYHLITRPSPQLKAESRPLLPCPPV